MKSKRAFSVAYTAFRIAYFYGLFSAVVLPLLFLVGVYFIPQILDVVPGSRTGAFLLSGVTSWIACVVSTLVLRQLAKIVGYFANETAQPRLLVADLNRTVLLLVALFFAQLIHDACVAYAWRLFGSLKSTLPPTADHYVHVLADYITPSFPGTSSLVLALLVYLLARFCEERTSLKGELKSLQAEAELIV